MNHQQKGVHHHHQEVMHQPEEINRQLVVLPQVMTKKMIVTIQIKNRNLQLLADQNLLQVEHHLPQEEHLHHQEHPHHLQEETNHQQKQNQMVTIKRIWKLC